MADDFEKAILFTFDQTGAVDSVLKVHIRFSFHMALFPPASNVLASCPGSDNLHCRAVGSGTGVLR